MKKILLIFFTLFLTTTVISSAMNIQRCAASAPVWEDLNHDGVQQPEELIIAFGDCSYSITYGIGWPGYLIVGIPKNNVTGAPQLFDFWFGGFVLNLGWVVLLSGGLAFGIRRKKKVVSNHQPSL